MKPLVKDFQDDMKLIEEVKLQASQGISKENLYIVSHDDDRTKRIVDKVNANEIDVNEEGLKIALENLFNSKGDELRNKFQEMGFSNTESEALEQELDHGKILLLIKQ